MLKVLTFKVRSYVQYTTTDKASEEGSKWVTNWDEFAHWPGNGKCFFFFLSFIRVRKAFLKSIAATVRKFQGYISMCTYNSDWPSSSSLPATKIEMLFYGLHGLADMPGGKTVESFSSLILQDQDQERERRGKIKSALIGHKIPLLNTAALLHVVVGIW